MFSSRDSLLLVWSQGGIPPDHIVETEQEILADMERLIKQHHDNSRFAHSSPLARAKRHPNLHTHARIHNPGSASLDPQLHASLLQFVFKCIIPIQPPAELSMCGAVSF